MEKLVLFIALGFASLLALPHPSSAFMLNYSDDAPIAAEFKEDNHFSIKDIWDFWKNDLALLTLFQFEKDDSKMFMKKDPEFTDPKNKDFISRINYEAIWPIGKFSFLVKKKSESISCPNSSTPGKQLEMKITEDSTEKVKNIANSFLLKICPTQDAKNGLAIKAYLEMDSKVEEKPGIFSGGTAINGIKDEIEKSIRIKLPKKLPEFRAGSLIGLNNEKILPQVDSTMEAQCFSCEPSRATTSNTKILDGTPVSSTIDLLGAKPKKAQ